MAVGATIAKVVASLAQNKEGRKVLKVVLGIIAGALILVIGVFFVIASALSQGPLLLLDWVFGGASVPPPEDAQQAITEMQANLTMLEEVIDAANVRLDSQKLDGQWIKAVFYILFYEQPPLSPDFFPDFVDCFVTTDDVGEPIPQQDNAALLDALRTVCDVTVNDNVLQQARMVYGQLLPST